MRVTEPTSQHSERPARGALLAVLFGILTVGLVAAFGAVDRPETAIEAVSSLDSAGADQAEGQRALHLAAAVAARTTPTPVVQAPVRVYDDGLGDLEGEIAQYEQQVLSAAPETVPSTTTTVAKPATTAAQEVTEPETTTTETTATNETTIPDDSTTSTETTVAETTSTEVTTETSETTVAGAESTTTTAAPPATTAHPDGWVDAGNGVYVPPVLVSIRYCESRDNYEAANPQFVGSRGLSVPHGKLGRLRPQRPLRRQPGPSRVQSATRRGGLDHLAARRHTALERQPELLELIGAGAVVRSAPDHRP